jgi:hypothetical protein
VLHSLGIDTYPSKYGFSALQVSATSVPYLREVIKAFLTAAPSAPPRDPLQELADQAQALDMGYGPNACPTCGKSAPSVSADAREEAFGDVLAMMAVNATPEELADYCAREYQAAIAAQSKGPAND